MAEPVRPKRSIDDASWRRLYEAVTSDPSLEARVLELMMLTAMRVGDIFRLQRREALRGLREGELCVVQKRGRTRTFRIEEGSRAQVALQKLVDTWGAAGTPDVLHALADSGVYMTAYNRVDRRLKRIGEAAGIPGRWNTHRLRRTVATQTWRKTKDLRAVQSMLGHKNMTTSQIYVDELAPDELARLQGNVQDAFLGDDD